MPGIDCQTVADAGQFDGTIGAGLWTFTHYNRIPRTSRVVLTVLSYVEIPDGPELTTQVQFRAMRPGGDPTEWVPLGDADAASSLLDFNGVARLKLCGIVLPREPGDFGAFWEVQCHTANKSQTATACLDYVICPYPDTHARDSAET